MHCLCLDAPSGFNTSPCKDEEHVEEVGAVQNKGTVLLLLLFFFLLLHLHLFHLLAPGVTPEI